VTKEFLSLNRIGKKNWKKPSTHERVASASNSSVSTEIKAGPGFGGHRRRLRSATDRVNIDPVQKQIFLCLLLFELL
jgi:hypothetical protein